jgi:DNA-binding response OmpR family regulator
MRTDSARRDALDTCEARLPDLLVLDLGLPDFEGVDVCRRIREDSKV